MQPVFMRATTDLIAEQLHGGKSVWLDVPSSSMTPFLVPGDRVLVHFQVLSEIENGDILLVHEGDVCIVHRLIERQHDWYVTKGDAQSAADRAVTANQVLGVVGMVEQTRHRRVALSNPIVRRLNRVIGTLSQVQAGLAVNKRKSLWFIRGLLRMLGAGIYSSATLARQIAEPE